MTKAIVVKPPHYTRTRRAEAWKAQQIKRQAKTHARNVRQGWKALKAEKQEILPAQLGSFNPIRGLAKVG